MDRFIHNYFYFLFYFPYVRILNVFVKSLKYLTWCKPLVPFGKVIFNRYHAKVLSYEDTRKIFSLNIESGNPDQAKICDTEGA